MRGKSARRAISRFATVAIAAVVIIILVVAAYFALALKAGSTSSQTTSLTGAVVSTASSNSLSSTSLSSLSSSSPVSSTISTTSYSSGSTASTLVVEDSLWPADDVNMLYLYAALPWPLWMAYSVYQSLIDVNVTAEYNQGIIQYLPGLAQNWTESSNGTIYALDLRQGVNFSNGDQFNAYQVWMDLYGQYYLTGNSSTFLENYDVLNMSNVNFGPATIAQINQSGGLINPSQNALTIMQNSSWPIYATNPHQIVFRLQAPFSYFLGIIVGYIGLIPDMQFVLDHGGFGTPTAINSYFNLNPIPGTGPYVITDVVENNYIKFVQNPFYWGTVLSPSQIASNRLLDPGHARNIIVYFRSDDVSRYVDLSSGTAQIAAIGTADWNLIASNQQYGYVTLPAWAGNAEILTLNYNMFPTNITLVRQAISHAINFSAIYQQAFGGHMSPFVGPEYPGWKDFYDLGNYPPYAYNLTLAKQLLAEANISNIPTLSLRIVTDCEPCTTMAEIVQSDLSDIGITVNVIVQTPTQYYANYGTYQTNVQNAQQIGQLSFVDGGEAWAPDGITPADFWLTFVSCKSVWGNFAGYCNPVVQQAVNALTSSSNRTYIQSLAAKAQAQVYSDTPYVWIGIVTLFEPGGGSLVWNKNVISSFLTDPYWTGQTTGPILNTVTFANGQ